MLSKLSIFLLSALAAFSAAAETIYYVAPHHGIVPRSADTKTIPGGAPDLVVTENGLTFNVFFRDVRANNNIGFDSPTFGVSARARFQEALEYIASVLNENGELDIVVELSETDGTGALAFAGTFYAVSAGFQRGSTLQRLIDGAKPFGGTEEITCTVDFGFDWNFTNGNPTPSEADFKSVILHELTHGLGFSSLSNSAGVSQITPGAYTVYDQLLRRRTGNKVLFSGSPPTFKGTAGDLISNDLMFFGAEADARYAPAERPGVFAPSPFQGGSSISHWDTGEIVGGAVMEHAIVLGTQRREYAALEIGALIDMGYVNAEDPLLGTPGNLSISPSGAQNLGTIQIGSVANRAFTIQNTGGTAINGTATTSGAPFSITSGTPFTVASGASAVVNVRFTPAVAGAAAGTLTINGDPDGAIPIALSGTGSNAPTPGNLTTSPDISGGVDMGEIESGSFSEFTFTLSNTGGTAISGNASTSGAPFAVTVGSSYNIAPGGSATVRVQFTPTDVIDFDGTLTLTGDPDGTIAVDLFGTGIKAGNAACAAVKGQRNNWSLADGAIVLLCGAALVIAARRGAAARA
jgi:hypothetical protein